MSLIEYDMDQIADLEERFYDIPFGNSAYQIKQFIVADQMTPARAYRALGINILEKAHTLQETFFKLRKNEIKLARKRNQLEQTGNKYEKQLFAIKIEELELNDRSLKKLINDAKIEYSVYLRELEKYPEYTRESFEAEEQLHFHVHLSRQLENETGAKESLHTMQVDSPMLEEMLTNSKLLGEMHAGIEKEYQQLSGHILEDVRKKLT